MASYGLIGSYSTVQVLSPTVVNDIEYCTIRTDPSGVIASKPVQRSVFESNQASSDLGNFAEAIEQIMTNTAVIAGVGSQTIEPSGLLVDNVVFTVEYPAGDTSGSAVTAEAVVPVNLLDFTDAEIGRVLLEQVDAIINTTYGNLKSAAGG